MQRRWVLLGLGACALVAALVYRLQRDPADHLTVSPTRLEAIDAELFYMDASAITRRGPPRVWVLRMPSHVEVVPHHYTQAGFDEPQPIEVWAKHLDVPVAFNAGQFDENLNHLGWLKSGGEWLTSYKHPQWMGVLVSGPLEGGPFTGIIDLEQANDKIVERYRHAVQSMMLVDENARVRVRDSDKTACRTVVAQDEQGRLLIIISEGAMTLGDLARWLPQTRLQIVRAMNLDGGIEAQLAVRTSELELALYGQYGTGTTVFEAGPGKVRYPLPAVVAIRPRR